MAYAAVPDTEIALDKPVKSSTHRKLRDNMLAVITADPTAPKIDPDAIAKTGTKSIQVLKWGQLNKAASSTSYAVALGLTSAIEANAEYYCVRPFTLKNLFARSNIALAGGDVVSTIRKNGADTALACTISAGSSTASDIVNSIGFSYGDRFSLKVASGAIGAGGPDLTFSASAYIPNTDEGAPFIPFSNIATKTLNRDQTVGEAGSAVSSSTIFSAPLPECFLCNYLLGATVGIEAVGVLDNNGIRKNEVILKVLTKGPGSQPFYHFSSMDLLEIIISGSATPDEYGITGGVVIESADPAAYAPAPMIFSSYNHVQSTVKYAGGWGANTASLTESEVQIPMPACTVKSLRFSANSAPTQNVICTVRKNGIDTGLTVTINGSRGGSNLVNTVTFNGTTDVLSIKVDPGATGTRSYNLTIEVTA